jgi:hypothetical protein
MKGPSKVDGRLIRRGHCVNLPGCDTLANHDGRGWPSVTQSLRTRGAVSAGRWLVDGRPVSTNSAPHLSLRPFRDGCGKARQQAIIGLNRPGFSWSLHQIQGGSQN